MTESTAALGMYLRARRDALSPNDAGIEPGNTRRVRGLRRQEVATLAGISPEYYLRLEQGKDHQPSGQVLLAIGRALRLDSDGTRYLFRIAGQTLPSTHAYSAPDDHGGTGVLIGDMSESVATLLEQWAATPAYVLDQNQDLLGANDLGRELFPFLASPNVNLVELATEGSMAADDASREYWDRALAEQVAALRYWCDLRDPRLQLLVASLSSRSRAFRDVWARHEARPFRSGTIAAAVAPFGHLNFRWQSLEVPGQNQFLFAYYGDPESPVSGAAIEFLRAKLVLRRSIEQAGALTPPPLNALSVSDGA